MFTLDQIKAAHSKVKSGAYFPAYIRDLKQLGVVHYVTFVKDGHTDYSGTGNFKTSSPARYTDLPIASFSNGAQFKADLKAHQQGKTDYPTFCSDCAKSGVEKWIVDLNKMTCTYFNQAGNEILVEQVSQ
jgi:uncharacterized protein YbcV (DUF1398 family)